MAQNLFSLESFYRTQPPEQIGETKVSSVLEFLAFSGSPVYLSLQDLVPAGGSSPAVVVDVLEDSFLIESSDLKIRTPYPVKVGLAFGYKRKRAIIETQILRKEGDAFVLAKPELIVLTNLRRNPRVPIEPDLHEKGLKVKIKASTAVGAIDLEDAQVYEMSQLGICLYVNRSAGLLLPGDKIESLEICDLQNTVLKATGVVARVDMKKHSPSLPQSYQVIILFREREKPHKESASARSAKRVPVLDEKPCFFSAEHPFFPGRKIQGQVYEISTSGLSCMLETTSFPVIPGMRFQNCVLQLPHRPSRDFVFEVVHVDFRSNGSVSQFKIGGEFVKAPIELIKDITAYSQEATGHLVQDVTEADLDLLWEFMFETNFIYQDKRRLLQGKSKEILETYHRLISTDNPLVKKIIFKEQNQIKGHVSAIRFYDYAWIIQHLNALKTSGASAAQQVIGAVVNFFYDARALHKNDVFYVMSYYRPNNMYPAVLFGESARRINDPLKSVAFDFSYGLFQPDESRRGPLVEVQIDQESDMIGLSDLLISKNLITFMRATGLSQPSDWSLKVAGSFKTQKLFRERHLLALHEEGNSAYAVIELSSVGLNLSELTNSIFAFSEGNEMDVVARLSTAVIEKAYQLYFEPRGIVPVILQPVDSTKASKVTWSKTYTCWITSATAVPEFEAQAATVIADFKELVGKFKNTPHQSEPGSSHSARK
jgi:hypothetical protein